MSSLAAEIVALVVQVIAAIVGGDHAKAARLAEEAARRQAVKLAAEATLRATK